MQDHTPQLPLFTTAPHDPINEIPYGYCHCGCGEQTKIATRDHTGKGHVKGQPLEYVYNHHCRIPIEIRFWRHVTQGTLNECWLWQGVKRKGYGVIGKNARWVLAHRLSWVLHNGPIPDNLNVLHRCDVKNCVNPNHLFLGSQADNVRDMDNKGRRGTGGGTKALGELNHKAKLKRGDIPGIRNLFASGTTKADIGRRYRVTAQSIDAIIRGETWKHVP